MKRRKLSNKCHLYIIVMLVHQPLIWSSNFTEPVWMVFAATGKISSKSKMVIIFIIIIKKDWQCKAGRGRLTPYQSEDPSSTLPTYKEVGMFPKIGPLDMEWPHKALGRAQKMLISHWPHIRSNVFVQTLGSSNSTCIGQAQNNTMYNVTKIRLTLHEQNGAIIEHLEKLSQYHASMWKLSSEFQNKFFYNIWSPHNPQK